MRYYSGEDIYSQNSSKSPPKSIFLPSVSNPPPNQRFKATPLLSRRAYLIPLLADLDVRKLSLLLAVRALGTISVAVTESGRGAEEESRNGNDGLESMHIDLLF